MIVEFTELAQQDVRDVLRQTNDQFGSRQLRRYAALFDTAQALLGRMRSVSARSTVPICCPAFTCSIWNWPRVKPAPRPIVCITKSERCRMERKA